MGHDPEGNPRWLAVKVDDGLVVWHSTEEYERLWSGVDREACEVLRPTPIPA